MAKQVRKLNLFLVGAPKCGTSALYTYLKAHPDISMSERKEPHYFGSYFQSRHTNPGLESDGRTDFAIVNPNSHPKNLWLRDFLSNPPGIVLQIGQRILPLARLVFRFLRRANTEPFQRPLLDENLRAELMREFAPQIESLSLLLERDLTHWCRPGTSSG